MRWNDKVPSCFGDADIILAGHQSDKITAKAVIKEAKNAGASFDDFAKEIVWHCYMKVRSENILREHIDTQVATAKRLWN